MVIILMCEQASEQQAVSRNYKPPKPYSKAIRYPWQQMFDILLKCSLVSPAVQQVLEQPAVADGTVPPQHSAETASGEQDVGQVGGDAAEADA